MKVNGINVYYTDISPGASKNSSVAVVLFHGFAGSTESWSEVGPALAHRLNCRVVAFDRPAFGRTERIMPPFPEAPWALSRIRRDPYSTEFAVELTLAFLKALDIERAVFVSHSLGADCHARVLLAMQALGAKAPKIAVMSMKSYFYAELFLLNYSSSLFCMFGLL